MCWCQLGEAKRPLAGHHVETQQWGRGQENFPEERCQDLDAALGAHDSSVLGSGETKSYAPVRGGPLRPTVQNAPPSVH